VLDVREPAAADSAVAQVDEVYQFAADMGGMGFITVDELTSTIAEVASKKLDFAHVEGSAGVQSRNFSHARIESLGWRPRFSLRDGLTETYPWVEKQVASSPQP
jgi:nucleoside-diphosphate-sugar epimerase